MHIVRSIKKYHHTSVANAMDAFGWVWKNPKQRPTNIERMLEGVPRIDLVLILRYLEERKCPHPSTTSARAAVAKDNCAASCKDNALGQEPCAGVCARSPGMTG